MSDGILVFASKRVGLECLTVLLEGGAPVEQVIVGKKSDQKILEKVLEKGIPVTFYDKWTQTRLVTEGKRYDWLLNLWSPHILGQELLALARRRLNTHPTLVPHCRGNDGTAWLIRKGLPAGVSLIEMNETIDAGDVYVQKEVPYLFPLVRGKKLHQQLEDELISLFKLSWPDIHQGMIIPTSQNTMGISVHTRKQTDQDRVQDASAVLGTLEDFMRWALAHDFSPGTTAEVRYNGRVFKITVHINEKDPGF